MRGVSIEVGRAIDGSGTETSSATVTVPETDQLHDRADQGSATPTLRPRAAFRALGAFLSYLALSVAIWGMPVVAHLRTRYVTPAGQDPYFFRWALGWAPWALTHGRNLLFTDRVFAPQGVDLTWVTISPGPAILMAPITRAFGTLASLNLLVLLASPLAAWAAYLVCVRITRSFWPSLLGGFLYGFCTFITGQMNHPNLALAFPVPLAVYLVIRRVEGSLGVKAFVALLALTLLGLFSISTEVFASAAVFGAIAWSIALVLGREERARLLRTVVLWGFAYALVAAIVLVPYVLPALRTAPTQSIKSPEHASDDLLRFVLPRNPTVVGGATLQSLSTRFTAASIGAGAYLGIALVALLVAFGITERRRRGTWGLLGFIAVSAILTLGPALHVAGDRVFGLPTMVIWKAPLIRNAIPDRFAAYTDLAVAVVAALWLSRARGSSTWSRWALVGVGAVMLIPTIRTPPWHPEDRTPGFFAEGTYASVLRPDENVLLIPAANGEEMTWQATAGFAFRMPGGYVGVTPAANRVAKPSRGHGVPGLWSNKAVVPSAAELSSWLAANEVDAVVVDDLARPTFEAVLRSVGLAPDYEGGGVSVWRLAPTPAGSG